MTAPPTVPGVAGAPNDLRIPTGAPDPRRWFTLAIVILSVLIVALDTTVLNVAIPTILRDLHTTLPSLQWVITGYSLTFASLLIIGGRLADLFGARRMFIIGAALFGVGSLLASLAQSVPVLIFGEAIIEGIGASLMMPATLGILSSTFHGHERATAFAMWGATAGAAVALGPLLGGFLTTNYSWRWSFRINLIVIPLAILGALLVMRRSPTASERERIDVPGALLIATGMFLLVFSLSEGRGTAGGDRSRTSASGDRGSGRPARGISVVPVAILVAVLLLGAFYRGGAAQGAPPRRPAVRVRPAAPAQLPVRPPHHDGAGDGPARLPLRPPGVPAGRQAPLRGRERSVAVAVGDLDHRRHADRRAAHPSHHGDVRGPRSASCSRRSACCSWSSPCRRTLTFWSLLPGLVVFGIGIGFAGSQLTNVILSEIPNERSGAASGANTTVRQLGAALGIAVIGALLTSVTISHAVSSVRASRLSASLKRASGPGSTPTASTSRRPVAPRWRTSPSCGTRRERGRGRYAERLAVRDRRRGHRCVRSRC